MIIGLAGAKHSGKNTVAKFIDEEFGDKYEVREWSFAEDLKKSAAAAIGGGTELDIGDPVAFCDVFKENGFIELSVNHDLFSAAWGISGRQFLQLYGTEAHRDIFGDDFWIQNTLDKIANVNTTTVWSERLDIITDVRFPNEAKAIDSDMTDVGVFRIRRPEVENDGDTHASEVPLPDDLIDYTINNVGTLDQLRNEVRVGVALWLS